MFIGLALAVGFVIGVIAEAVVIWRVMPRMMIAVHESRFDDVDETCQALQTAIAAQGWNCPAVRNMNANAEQQGVKISRPVRIVEMCKAEYAQRVLEASPEISTLMPCAWGVYRSDDGKVRIAAMNTGLMGKIFGGVIAEVMGRAVAKDERAILAGVVRAQAGDA